MCMPMSSKFLTESTGEKIVKIGQYLAKIWTKYDSLLFLGHPVYFGQNTFWEGWTDEVFKDGLLRVVRHTARKHKCSLEKKMIQGCTLGSRIKKSRSRQRRRWTDDISEWTAITCTINDAATVVKDREFNWEGLYAANPSYRPMWRTAKTTTTIL